MRGIKNCAGRKPEVSDLIMYAGNGVDDGCVCHFAEYVAGYGRGSSGTSGITI